MRYLGIDYGTKRVGLAVSDEGGTLAFPYAVLENNTTLFEEIVDICQKENVKEIVVGESLDYHGNQNLLMQKILPFKEKLFARLKIPVHFHTEVLTSREAKQTNGDLTFLDARAATIMLQSFLDSRKYRV